MDMMGILSYGIGTLAGFAAIIALLFVFISDITQKKHGVLQEKELDGVRRECLVRSTFVIDKKGVIRHAFYNVNPRHHAAEVFDVVKRLRV